ncbi:hypothetical protein LWI29_021410 [Acer saccharum]|uniref:Uncharacterized protein n=1 Tax=Acer saccharum TaxID=4024 RepID=A0AA39SIT9_ACESA|nr:hypothetical protein LWI29_021410 [Acer saccharum]
MARVEWGYQGRGKWNCSYKKITLIVCSINIVIALYVLHTLYASIYVHSNTDFNNAVKYTPDQIEKMEESIRIRRAKEPIQLVKILELSREDSVLELLPQPVKQRMADEILQRLHSLDAKTNVSAVRGGCSVISCHLLRLIFIDISNSYYKVVKSLCRFVVRTSFDHREFYSGGKFSV